MTWDMPLLQNVFLPCDVDIIQTIPLSKRRPSDALIWNGTKSGIFLVKSAYRMLLDNNRGSKASTSGGFAEQCWPAIWSASVQPKVRVFL
jgi:hypothetical protein